MTVDFILASASQRRQELLKRILPEFRIKVSDFNEDLIIYDGDPRSYVKRLALEKAKAISHSFSKETYILGADTVVYFQGKILEKPIDRNDAYKMIKMMQGNTHQVYSGMALIQSEHSIKDTLAIETEVLFAPMDEREIQTYLDTDEWRDKAGGYGIQGFAARHITGIHGDYYNVMGLPLQELYKVLKKYNIKT